MSTVLVAQPDQVPYKAAAGRRLAYISPPLIIAAVLGVLVALIPALRGASKLLFLVTLVPLALWTAFTNSERAIYVYIGWCWFDGSIRGVFDDNSVSILARDLVMVVIVVGWLVRRNGQQRWDAIIIPPLTLVIALFAIDCVVQFANPFSLGIVNNIAGLKVHLSAIPLYFVAYDVYRNKHQVRDLAIFLTVISVIGSLVAGNQYLHGREWTYAHYPGASQAILSDLQLSSNDVRNQSDLDVVNFRPPGCTTVGGGAGVFDALIAPLTFALLLASRERRLSARQRFLTAGVLLLFVVTIFTGGLREALVQMVLGIAACAWICGGKLRGRALAALGICIIFGILAWSVTANLSQGAMSHRWSSLFTNPEQALHSDRKTFFDQVGDLVCDSPFGVGLGREGAAAGHLGDDDKSLGFHAFSEAYFGFLILEVGIPGALLMGAVVLSFVVRGIQAVQRLPMTDDRLLSAALAAILFVLAIHCFASPVLVQPPGSVMFWLIGAIVMRTYVQEHARATQQRQQGLAVT